MVWLESFCPADASVVGVRAGVCSGVRAARPFQGPGLLLGIGPIFGPTLFISSGTFRPSIYDIPPLRLTVLVEPIVVERSAVVLLLPGRKAGTSCERCHLERTLTPAFVQLWDDRGGVHTN